MRKKQTFELIVDSIFNDKSKYMSFTDEDKVNSFYMINKKFWLGKPKICNFFNDKHIDKASATDLWRIIFKNDKKIPYWYWAKSNGKKEKVEKLPKSDKELIMEYEDLSEQEFDLLYKYYKDEMEYKIKLLKRLD